MELKSLLMGLTVAALVAACSSDDNVTPSPSTGDQGQITIRTTLDQGQGTRVSLTEQGVTTPSLKVAWQNTDQLVVGYSAATSPATFAIGTISADGHNAEFTGSLTPAPTQTTDVYAMANTAAAPLDGTTAQLDLSAQTGKIDDLGTYDLLMGRGSYDPANASSLFVSMAHQVAFIRGTIVLPFTPTDANYALTLKGDDLYTRKTYSLTDGTSTAATAGDIRISAAKVAGNRLTFYAAVLPQTLRNLRADVVSPSGQAYADLLVTDEFTVQAGRLYTVTRSNETLADVNLWTDNQAWTKVYDVANYKIATVQRIPAEGSDWLSVESDGSKVTVKATANTTGAPRQAKLIFGNGSQQTTIDLTQIDESDFAGYWNMVAFKKFYSTGSLTTVNYDTKWSGVGTTPSDGRTDLKIVDGVNYNNKTELTLVNKTGKNVTAYECLNYKQQTATNNISITGLFENMTTEALSKVDYDSKAATVSIFFDTKTGSTPAQRLYTGQYAGQYVALMPELSTGINSGWSFQYATIGGAQYAWYVGKVSVSGHTTTVRWSANTSTMQKLKTSASTPTLYVCGLQVMRYIASTINANNMIRQKMGGFPQQAAWAVTYQGDIVISRTADGYKDIEIGGGSN